MLSSMPACVPLARVHTVETNGSITAEEVVVTALKVSFLVLVLVHTGVLYS